MVIVMVIAIVIVIVIVIVKLGRPLHAVREPLEPRSVSC